MFQDGSVEAILAKSHKCPSGPSAVFYSTDLVGSDSGSVDLILPFDREKVPESASLTTKVL